MTDFTIVLGNKAYSSWSLRGWLMLKQTGVAFSEVIIPLDRPEMKAEILAHSPSGRVPALKAGDLTIWDSLAIAEYLDERFPGAGLWPQDPEARAVARGGYGGNARRIRHPPRPIAHGPQASTGARGRERAP